MSRNPYADGQPFSVVALNAQKHAHNNEGVLEGCSVSITFDQIPAVSSGEILIDGAIVTVGGGSVPLESSDNEDRIDLVVVDSNGDVDDVTGTPATEPGQPDAPEIPDDHVLLAAVYVRGGSDEILAGDLYDEYRTVIGGVPPGLIDPGGDGAIPNSALDNDSVTINTGNQLSGGGPIGLGGSRTIDVEDGQGSGLDADTVWGTDGDHMVPTGGIILWSGLISEIPSGWLLCDGNNGTPDLEDRFVVGAGGNYDVDDTGGTDTVQLSTAEHASHVHEMRVRTGTGSPDDDVLTGDTGVGRDLNYDTADTASSGGDSPHENRPPYYALAYIMKA